MPRLNLRNHQTGEIIFEGHFPSARACVEQAITERICLDYVDLRHANLAFAALDDAVMRHAVLDHTNLTGANLSEADLTGTSFRGAMLHGACLCFSDLKRCSFTNGLFGGTDIAGTILDDTQFSLLSAFSLNFIDAQLSTAAFTMPAQGPPARFPARRW